MSIDRIAEVGYVVGVEDQLGATWVGVHILEEGDDSIGEDCRDVTAEARGALSVPLWSL